MVSIQTCWARILPQELTSCHVCLDGELVGTQNKERPDLCSCPRELTIALCVSIIFKNVKNGEMLRPKSLITIGLWCKDC